MHALTSVVSVLNPRLDKRKVKAIKKAIVAGRTLGSLADEYGVSYMTVYKIATGANWKKVRPRGRLIPERDYSERRSLSLSNCEKIALAKIKKRVSNARIARRLQVSESTIRRAVVDGRAALSHRLHVAAIAGKSRNAKKRFDLSDDDADALMSIGKIPDWITREIDDDG